MTLKIIYCLFLISSVCCLSESSTLRLVQVVFRHGDRTPTGLFPSDVHNDHWKSLGLGMLTKTGIEQHYALGQFIRSRYTGFVPTEYTASKVRVRSTDIDRTLMSALSNLAGLFPPVGDQVWNQNLLWQPIPVHTILNRNDTLLEALNSYCPRFDQLRAQEESTPEYQKVLQSYQSLMDLLTEKTGEDVKTLEDIWDIFDTIRVERLYNLTLEDWAIDNYDQMLQGSVDHLKWLFPSVETRKLRGGPLLKEMIDNINNKINNKDDSMQLYYYSAHDTTIAAFLINLNLYNDMLPPYASAVFVELHDVNDQHFVQLSYRNETTQEPHVLTLPGCTELCPISTFQLLTKNAVPADITVDCQSKSKHKRKGVASFFNTLFNRNIPVLPKSKHCGMY